MQVAGELDVATSRQLAAALHQAQAHARLVVLDLRSLTFMDTSGVHAILDATSAARRRHGRLLVVCSHAAERVLTLTAVHDQVEIIELEPTEHAARALLRLS
ncbi:MAG: STAS domain-containing protein [Solirubrobacteraceae bacterium]